MDAAAAEVVPWTIYHFDKTQRRSKHRNYIPNIVHLRNNGYDVYGYRAFVCKSGIFSVYLLDISAINSIFFDFYDDDYIL